MAHWDSFKCCPKDIATFFQLFFLKESYLKGVMEPSEPERGAEAHEVRRSAELVEILGSKNYEFL